MTSFDDHVHGSDRVKAAYKGVKEMAASSAQGVAGNWGRAAAEPKESLARMGGRCMRRSMPRTTGGCRSTTEDSGKPGS